VFGSDPARFGDVMSLARLLAVTAAVQANVDNNAPTNVYQFAEQLQAQFPDLCPAELIKLIELAIVEIRGAAVWNKPDTEH